MKSKFEITVKRMNSYHLGFCKYCSMENVKKQEEAPVLPMEDNTREDELFSKDLQEELEAKFDELFGSVDTSKKDN